MTHAGYFEGIGGFSLAAEMVGIETIYTCEIDDFRNAWLQYRFQNATHERDIKTANGIYADLFTGGFPCQDISVANPKGKGLEGDRSGLWWEFYRHICLHRPRYVVLENSPNLTNKGLVDILTAFAKIGYDAEWDTFTKQSLGFPDKRQRLFVVAYSNQVRRDLNQRVFSKFNYKMCRKKNEETFSFRLKTQRILDQHSLREAHSDAISMDTGLSKRLVKAEIEAYGDAVCPHVAALVLMMIQMFDQHQND